MRRVERSDPSAIHLFRDLTPGEHNTLAAQISARSYEAGDIVYEQGDPGHDLLLLLHGQVQLYRLAPTGQRLTTITLGPGSFFGEGAIVGDGRHARCARCMEPGLIGRISGRKFLWLLSAKPTVGRRFAAALVDRNKQLEQRMEALAFKDVSARLATLLLSMAEQSGLEPARVDGLRYQDLGDLMGAYHDIVANTLSEFSVNGLIEIGHSQITLVDRPNLELVALHGGGLLAQQAGSNDEVTVLLDSEGPAFS